VCGRGYEQTTAGLRPAAFGALTAPPIRLQASYHGLTPGGFQHAILLQSSKLANWSRMTGKKKPQPIGSWILIVAGAIELIVSFVLTAPRYEALHNFLLSMGVTMMIIGLVWLIFSQRGSGSRQD